MNIFNRHKCPKCGQKMEKTTIEGVVRHSGYVSMDDYREKDWTQVRYLCRGCKIIAV